jgi:hypothetical protein
MLDFIIQYKAEFFWYPVFTILICYLLYWIKDQPTDIEELVARYEEQARKKKAKQF